MPHPTDGSTHHPLRVLVVEDNLLIAETLCDALADCGCEVVGPVTDMPQGLALIAEQTPDGAMLDINLSGILSFPLATVLEERGVPFVFMTGYDDGVLFPPEFRKVRRIAKPFDSKDIAEVLEVWGRMVGA
jgi:CheY-like chemotaxis protein